MVRRAPVRSNCLLSTTNNYIPELERELERLQAIVEMAPRTLPDRFVCRGKVQAVRQMMLIDTPMETDHRLLSKNLFERTNRANAFDQRMRMKQSIRTS